ncbi:MAG: ABC transporter ATP-binding protein [Thermoplasmata archaeon]|nr:ABC transporter ATP-binding protein [Thermoplasmata archaeon]
MASEVLSLEHLSKRYGSREALRDVSFHLAAGESVGYLGPNGAGKTTTLRMIAGLTVPSGGTVRIHGKDPSRERADALARVGVLVETPGLVPYVLGEDLLDYIAAVKGVPSRHRATAIREAARQLGVEEHLARPVGSLSTGLARRLLLAGALIGDPEILLLDEPTLGLDPAARQDLRKVLSDLRRAGRTILLSTHLLEDVQELCDRVLFLRDGQLVGDEPVERVRTDPRGAPLRGLHLRFIDDIVGERLRSLLGEAGTVELDGPREATVYFPGDERRQAELLAAIIGAGLPLASASPPEPELGRRYLAKVGREDAT